LKALVLKTSKGATSSRVRIPDPPPSFLSLPNPSYKRHKAGLTLTMGESILRMTRPARLFRVWPLR